MNAVCDAITFALMAQTITIPERTHEDFGHSLIKLLRMERLLSFTQEKEIVLDFRRARMLNPFFLAGLVCSVRHFEATGKTVSSNHKQNDFIRTCFF